MLLHLLDDWLLYRTSKPLAYDNVALRKELLPGKVSAFGRYAKARHLCLFACTHIRLKELRGKEGESS